MCGRRCAVFAWVCPYARGNICTCNRGSNGLSNSDSSSGSYSTSNLESSGQSYGESNEDGDSGRNGQSDR